jgi:hypothetical protein
MNNFIVNVSDVLESFCELIKQEGITNLPDITIDRNNSVGILVSGMSTTDIAISPKDSVKETITKLFDKFIEYIADQNNITRVEILSILSSKLAITLENAFNTLTEEIGSEVETLFSDINKRYNDLLKERGGLEFSDSDTVNESMYSIIDWGALNNKVRQNSIIEDACTNAGFVSADLSSMKAANIIAKSNFGPITKVEFDKTTEEVIFDLLYKTFTQKAYGFTEESVNKCFKMLTTPTVYNSSIAKLKSIANSNTNTASNVLTTLATVREFEAMNKNVLAVIGEMLSNDTMTVISKNIAIVNKSITSFAYWLLVHKEIKFKNMLVFSGKILNGEVYKSFLSAGKTITDIYNFTRLKYKNDELPELGVSSKVIIDSDISVELATMSNTIQRQKKFITTKSLIDAFEVVCISYVKKRGGDIQQAASIINSLSNRLKGNMGVVQDVLYQLIIDIYHNNTIVAKLFKYLDKSFKGMFVDDREIEDEDVLMAEYNAVVNILVDFLFDTIVE